MVHSDSSGEITGHGERGVLADDALRHAHFTSQGEADVAHKFLSWVSGGFSVHVEITG